MRHSTLWILTLGALASGVSGGCGQGGSTAAVGAPSPDPVGPSPGQTTPPNVIVMLADDLGVDMLGVYGEGSDLPATPSLDALAGAGVLFRNAWSQPVCSPTRAGIITGRHSFRNGIGWIISPTGVGLDMSTPTLPELMDAASAGYTKGAFGKWHLGNAATGGTLAPNLSGFDYFSGTLSSLLHPEDYFHWTHVTNGSTVFETSYEPEEITDEAITWMNARTQPFLCYLAFNLPHSPYHRPPDHLHDVDFSGVNPDPALEPRPYYKAMVEAVDTLVGRVLTEVDPDILANSLILFLGDNGTPQAVVVPPFQPGHGKTTTFEGGVNVPLIAAGPMVTMPGAECAALVQTLDLYGTIAALAGVDYQSMARGVTFDTVSLLPYLVNPLLPSIRSTVYTDLFYPNGEPPDLSDYTCPSLPTPPGNGSYAQVSSSEQLVCQTDIGYGGPGNTRLRICGPGLEFSASSVLTIDNGPPGAAGILLEGNGLQPIPFGAGTIVPAAALYFQSSMITLDASGTYRRSISHLGGTELVYYQAVVIDPMLPGGIGISNAVEARMFTHSSAIRDERYKLMLDAYTCQEALYDLASDPFELTNLLEQGLDMSAQASFAALKSALFALVNS